METLKTILEHGEFQIKENVVVKDQIENKKRANSLLE